MSDLQTGDAATSGDLGRLVCPPAALVAAPASGRLFSLSLSRVFHGPNPLAHAPVVACHLRTLGEVGVRLAAAHRLLSSAFPRFGEDVSDPARPVEPAVALARMIAAWAKGALNETRGFIEAAGALRSGAANEATLWVGFHDPKITNAAIGLATQAVAQVLHGDPAFPSAQLTSRLAELQQRCRERHPDFQARILMVAARKRGIPVLPFEQSARLWQFGWGSRGHVFFETASDQDGFVGSHIARSKTLSKSVLRDLGLPTPAGVVVKSRAELPAAAGRVGWPCVVKPIDRGGGKGVTAGVRSLPELERAFERAQSFSPGPFIVETFIAGDDYRLSVIDGRLIATTRRTASAVTGDGVRTVRQLVGEINRDRSSNIVASRYLRPVDVDTVLSDHLASQNIALDDVLEPGRRVALRSNANRSTGGTCITVTNLHPDIRGMVEMLAVGVGLRAVGFDYITTDITRPPAETGGCFIEINTTPGMAVHIAGGMDEAEVGSIFLGPSPGRIPFVLVLAAEAAQAELARSLAAAKEMPGLAWLCGQDAGFHGLRLDLAHLAAPDRVRALLKHRAAKAAAVVWSTADLQQLGMPVDKADLAILHGTEIAGSWQRVVEATCGRPVRTNDLEAVMTAIRSAVAIK